MHPFGEEKGKPQAEKTYGRADEDVLDVVDTKIEREKQMPTTMTVAIGQNQARPNSRANQNQVTTAAARDLTAIRSYRPLGHRVRIRWRGADRRTGP